MTVDMYFARSRTRVSVTNTRDSQTPCEGEEGKPSPLSSSRLGFVAPNQAIVTGQSVIRFRPRLLLLSRLLVLERGDGA